MTIEQILDDIRTDRVKKAILDADMGIEMDDQYALAHCIGSDKIDLLSVNAATFGKGATGDYVAGMEASYREIERVLTVCGRMDIPHYRGATRPIMFDENNGPVDSPAAQNIIKTVRESDEIVYVLSTGCCTNIVSACLMDPTIKDNMCVIWLGCNCFDRKEGLDGECNLEMDYSAGQLLLGLDIPLVLLPAYDHGTMVLEIVRDDLNRYLPGDSAASVFFRDTLPDQFADEPFYVNGWWRVLFDVAAPAVLTVPYAFEFRIIPAPVITDDKFYAFDKTRHKIIFMDSINREITFDDTFACIGRI